MVAEAVEITFITDALFEGRETPVSRQARILAESIEGLCLANLVEEAAMLLGVFHYRFGISEAIKALRLEYGEDVEDRLGISLTRGGSPNVPGTYVLLDRVETDLLPAYQRLQLEFAQQNFILKMPTKPKLSKVE